MPLFVPLTNGALMALREMARRERRRPQEQAAVLIERALAEAAEQAARTQPRDDCERVRVVADG